MENEDGMTLVEVLVTLILLMLVTGIIWTTILITSRFNISETSNLNLQKEANYIITSIQQVHRQCFTYKLSITNTKIEIEDCVNDKGTAQNDYNGVISQGLLYNPLMNEVIQSTKRDVDLVAFTVKDPISNRVIDVPTVISRFKTEKGDKTHEGTE